MHDIVADERAKIIATFAAAIVTVRGVADVMSLKDAWTDAKFIIFPDPVDDAYRAWQRQWSDRVPPHSIRRVG